MAPLLGMVFIMFDGNYRYSQFILSLSKICRHYICFNCTCCRLWKAAGRGGGGKLTYLDQDVFVVDSCYTNDPKRATTIVPEHAIKFRNKKVCLQLMYIICWFVSVHKESDAKLILNLYKLTFFDRTFYLIRCKRISPNVAKL